MSDSPNNSLFTTLKNLRGNPRACIFTEPLWGISIGLILPYASVYMLANGLVDSQVGFIAMIFMLSQVGSAFLSGPITDKLGRRRTTAISDFTAFCIPCLIWFRATNFWFFLVAAIINGTFQIAVNSYNCLLIEDAEPDQITGIKSLSVTAAQLSAFFGPLVALLFARLTLIPAMRVLYLYAFITMSTKILLCYRFTRETKMGAIRREETRRKSLFSLAMGYGGVLNLIRSSRGTIFALAISILVGIVVMINNTFWQVIVSQKLLVPIRFLPFFPLLRASMIITFLFFIGPRITRASFKGPLLLGFVSYLIGQSILILIPVESPIKYLLISISLIFDGFGFGSLFMLARSLVALNVNPRERARIMAIINMIIMAITAPFGWIAGLLSGISRTFPFVLSLLLLAAGICITLHHFNRGQVLKTSGH